MNDDADHSDAASDEPAEARPALGPAADGRPADGRPADIGTARRGKGRRPGSLMRRGSGTVYLVPDDADPRTETETRTETDSGTDTDTETDSGTDTDTETDTDSSGPAGDEWPWVAEWRAAGEPTPWATGLVLATFSALVVAVAVWVLSAGLADRPIVAVLVNVLVAGGLAPAMWLSRDLPVLRWIAAGALVGILAGWVAAILLLPVPG